MIGQDKTEGLEEECVEFGDRRSLALVSLLPISQSTDMRFNSIFVLIYDLLICLADPFWFTAYGEQIVDI